MIEPAAPFATPPKVATSVTDLPTLMVVNESAVEIDEVACTVTGVSQGLVEAACAESPL